MEFSAGVTAAFRAAKRHDRVVLHDLAHRSLNEGSPWVGPLVLVDGKLDRTSCDGCNIWECVAYWPCNYDLAKLNDAAVNEDGLLRGNVLCREEDVLGWKLSTKRWWDAGGGEYRKGSSAELDSFLEVCSCFADGSEGDASATFAEVVDGESFNGDAIFPSECAWYELKLAGRDVALSFAFRGTFWFVLLLLFDGGADAELASSLELDFLEEFVVPDPLEGA